MDDLGKSKRPQRNPEVKIPIYIAEDHHKVVEFIHEMIKQKRLPITGNNFIHLDSHPDMLIPKDMPADYAFDKLKLYESHDIENWIIPNCYNGIINRVVWVKPPWANQITTKSQIMFVGKCTETGTIRLECKENYYIAEGLYKPRDKLEDVKEIRLDCVTLGSAILKESEDLWEMRSETKSIGQSGYILDIDLDFFSTQNPFLNIYDKVFLYQRLQEIFAFECPESSSEEHILKAQEKRLAQLKEIEDLFKHLEKFKAMPKFEGPDPGPLHSKVAVLVELLNQNYTKEEIDWDLIYSAGCTIDDHELPHHVSTDDEVDILIDSLIDFLATFEAPPLVITISRSSSDDYTPQEQVDDIQDKVLSLLYAKFSKCDDPILAFLDEDYDEKKD